MATAKRTSGTTGRRDRKAAWQLAAMLLLSAGAHAGTECAAPDASGARLCTAGVRGDIVRGMEATQERSNWCWAAVVSMMLRRHGVAATQHDIVTRSLGAPLDQRLRTAEIPAVFDREWHAASAVAGMRARTLSQRLHLSDPRVAATVVDTLAADQPLIMSARGHAVLLVGAIYLESPDGGGRKVMGGLVVDPLPGRGLRYLQEDEMAPALLAQVEIGVTPAPATGRTAGAKASARTTTTARAADPSARVRI
ncbi:MAG TPA: hypothetical protein VIL30_25445 [Ramlibacter sp.]